MNRWTSGLQKVPNIGYIYYAWYIVDEMYCTVRTQEMIICAAYLVELWLGVDGRIGSQLPHISQDETLSCIDIGKFRIAY